ncbi:MAG TPA: hypothetical protein H9769_08850 [Candidatus Microbacterium pullistercoris]|nr:hypothetical protein [Candidatus Microbacterium pullistercoris]
MTDVSAKWISSAPKNVDILIIGSGPIGATFAREIRRQAPDRSILMVEAGPQLTAVPGENVRNLETGRRLEAQHRATIWTGQATSDTGRIDGRIAARPGTFLLGDGEVLEDDQTGMPAAAVAANVGGMGAHWTCACPRPGGSERIPFLEDVFDDAFDHACELLGVTQTAFPQNEVQSWLQSRLSAIFDQGR